MKLKNELKPLMKYLKEDKSKIIFAIISIFITSILGLSYGYLVGKVVEEVTNYQNEGFTYEEPALSYIARLSKGGMRDAISRLDMCSSLDHNITLKNVVSVLGLSDDNVDSDLLYSIYDALYTDNEANREASEKCIINILEQIYNSGKDIIRF